MSQYLFCFAVLLTMLFAAVFSVATCVGDCWWYIYARDVLMVVAFLEFFR